jgi:Icc-related predicted phosphoesterase
VSGSVDEGAVRIAAAGDLHFGVESAGSLRPGLQGLAKRADTLLLAGDLTRLGLPEEAAVLADELAGARIPVVAVLGNHDYQSDRQDQVAEHMRRAGVTVIEEEATVMEFNGCRVGIAGAKGFGGGFAGASGSDFGEPEMKSFIRHTKDIAGRLELALAELRSAGVDLRIVLTHYAPIRDTLMGEPPEIYPFLGSYLLGEAIDRVGATLALHGHAHRGTEKGVTPGGVHVRNVAQAVIGRPFNIYRLPDPGRGGGTAGVRRALY